MKGLGSEKGLEIEAYFRITPAEKARVDAIAREDEVSRSVIYRRALRAYLAGGAKEYAREKKELLARDVAEPTHEQLAGRWISSLPRDVREGLFRLGEALRSTGLASPLDDVVLPEWVDTTPYTAEAGGTRRKRKAQHGKGPEEPGT